MPAYDRLRDRTVQATVCFAVPRGCKTICHTQALILHAEKEYLKIYLMLKKQ